MPVFKDTEQMYEVLGELFNQLLENKPVAQKFYDDDINIKYEITEPDGEIWLLHGDDWPEVVVGEADAEADITMWLKGDDCHNFWLQKLKLPIALAKRKIKAKGPMSKILGMLPMLKPAYEAYPEICEKYGLPT
jgi:putative sterol carrier protein